MTLPPTFWSLVERAASSAGDRVILADDYGRSLSNAQLHDAALGVAAGLAATGVREGSVVSWQLPTTLEAVVVLVALARLGAVQNPLIPMLREREVRFITGQVGCEVLVVPERWRGFEHAAMAREVAAQHGFDVVAVDLETPPAGAALRLPAASPATLPPPAPAGATATVRWLYYSSGTTAEPKGARHTDASIMAGAAGMLTLLGIAEPDVYPIAWPIAHIGGSTMLTASLVGGARLVLFDAFDPASTPERMAAHRPTILGSAVPFFNAYIAAQHRHGEQPLFPALRVCTGGGAPIPAEMHDELRTTFGVDGIVCSWGLTEFPIATSARPADSPEVLATTVGQPSPGVEVRAVLPSGDDAAPGQEGELLVRGPQRCAGYVDADLDATAFVDGWFRTGDLGVVDSDGNVRITGRLKDVIIRNAENISALEIEEALHRHEDVAEAAVVGVPDARTGERVCAFIVPRQARGVTLEALRDHCHALGIAIQKCPEQLVLATELPRNSMGKVLKQQLRQQLVTPPPEEGR